MIPETTLPATAQRPVPHMTLAEPKSTIKRTDEVTLDKTVCYVFDFDSVNFTELSVGPLLEKIVVDSPATHGNRLTAYFGNTAYHYRFTNHDQHPSTLSNLENFVFDIFYIPTFAQ